jgi:hypothetical protein
VIQGLYNVRITIYRGTSHCSFNGIITEIQQVDLDWKFDIRAAKIKGGQ